MVCVWGDSMAITMRDIAEKAGVSVTTVSRVLNNRDDVIPISEVTAERIRAIARELGYSPNISARRLATGKSQVIAVVLNSMDILATHVNIRILQGMGDVLNQNNYRIDLIDRNKMIGDDFQRYFLDMINGVEADGIIIWDTYEDYETANFLKELAIPCCYVQWHPEEEAEVYSVISDNTKGGYLVADHLIRSGHTKIAFVAPKMDQEAMLRHAGYLMALNEHGIAPNKDFYVDATFHGEDTLESLNIDQLNSVLSKVTAIITVSDYMAIGVIQFLANKGVRVPEDIAVTGFDDIALAKLFYPSLTTVRQNGNRIGRLAAKSILKQLNGGKQDRCLQLVDVELVVRSSSVR